MYTSIMNYCFKPEKLDEAVGMWKTAVVDSIQKQPGFVRVQFYTQASGKAMAMGSWEQKENAEDFMNTGIFKEMLSKFESYMDEMPRHEKFNLEVFEQK